MAVLDGREGTNDGVYARWIGTDRGLQCQRRRFRSVQCRSLRGKNRGYGLVFLELFKANEVLDVSLNQWIRRLPPEMVYSHLKLDKNAIQSIPAEKLEIVPR